MKHVVKGQILLLLGTSMLFHVASCSYFMLLLPSLKSSSMLFLFSLSFFFLNPWTLNLHFTLFYLSWLYATVFVKAPSYNLGFFSGVWARVAHLGSWSLLGLYHTAEPLGGQVGGCREWDAATRKTLSWMGISENHRCKFLNTSLPTYC